MMSIIMLLYVILFMPLNVNALHDVIDSRCTNALKTSLREEANDVVYRLSKVESNNGVTYTAYFYNLTDNIYISFNDAMVHDNKIENLKPGSSIAASVYSSNNNYCSGYKAKTLIINIPFYNPYFNSEKCSGFDNYYLCQEHVNVTLTEEEFNKKLNEYKESLVSNKKEEIIEEENNEEPKNNGLLGFISEYRYYIIAGVILLLIIIIIELVKKNKKERGIL